MKATVTALATAVLLSLAALLGAEAQSARNVPRIGYLSTGTPDSGKSRFAAFRQGLRELGYSEGENIVIERRYAEGRYDRLPELAADLVRLKVDVLVAAGGTPAALAAKKATSTVPIVMVAVGNPVGNGFVASLGRPGGNITGNTTLSPETRPKSLQLLREAIPHVSRLAYLWNPTNPANVLSFQETRSAAQAFGMTLQSVEVSHPTQFEGAFTALTRKRPDALMMGADSMHLLHVGRVLDFAGTHRLPAMYPLREHVIAGGLMSYGANLSDLVRRAATYVDKILKGAKPADLPVEQPTTFELVINLKTAKTLGLTIPPSLLLRADQLIE